MEEKAAATVIQKRPIDGPISILESEMHQAIKMCDKEVVNKLLKQGDKLCNGVDASLHCGTLNCFILAYSVGDWEFVKFLLSIDPEAGIAAKNSDGLTLLMLYATEHKFEEVQHLLQLGADPKDRSSDGSTALILALSYVPPTILRRWYCSFERTKEFEEKCQCIMDLLIQRGADVNICDVFGRNALHLAVQTVHMLQLEIVQSLINAGIDPTAETNEQCTILTYALQTFVYLGERFRNDTLDAIEAYSTLQYIFKLPQFLTESFQIRCSTSNHPQSLLLENLSICRKFTGNKSIFSDLIVSNKNLFNPGLIVMVSSCKLCLILDVEHVAVSFGPIAYYLNHARGPTYNVQRMSTFDSNLMENVQYLMSVGFSVNVQDTISPLTIGLLRCYPQFDCVAFVRYMVDIGVHMEQRILNFRSLDNDLEQLSAELCLPDALRVVLYYRGIDPSDAISMVKLFLPHYAHPGWTLLPFISPAKMAALFPFLCSCGVLQNTALHNKVKARILNSGLLSEEQRQTFIAMNSCVPTLQDLCRTGVLAQLAPRACQHGNSLPALIESVPPLVTPLNRLLDVAQFLK